MHDVHDGASEAFHLEFLDEACEILFFFLSHAIGLAFAKQVVVIDDLPQTDALFDHMAVEVQHLIKDVEIVGGYEKLVFPVGRACLIAELRRLYLIEIFHQFFVDEEIEHVGWTEVYLDAGVGKHGEVHMDGRVGAVVVFGGEIKYLFPSSVEPDVDVARHTCVGVRVHEGVALALEDAVGEAVLQEPFAGFVCSLEECLVLLAQAVHLKDPFHDIVIGGLVALEVFLVHLAVLHEDGSAEDTLYGLLYGKFEQVVPVDFLDALRCWHVVVETVLEQFYVIPFVVHFFWLFSACP